MLAGIYYGAQYGGSVASILLNLPGTPSSAVICLDGYPMQKQGRAGPEIWCCRLFFTHGGGACCSSLADAFWDRTQAGNVGSGIVPWIDRHRRRHRYLPLHFRGYAAGRRPERCGYGHGAVWRCRDNLHGQHRCRSTRFCCDSSASRLGANTL